MITTKKKLMALLMVPLALQASATYGNALQDRVAELEKQLKALKSELAGDKKKQQEKGVELKKGTRFQYGGYIKVDAMVSDYDSGERATAAIGENIYVPSTIPVGGSDGDSRFHANVKTSRLWFKTFTETDVGTIRSHFEADYLTFEGDERISNSSGNRLRHAFLAWDYEPGSSILAGQTWSTFFNVGALPEAVDFVGPTSGTLFNRQTQLRWTKKVGDGSFMLSAENPSTSLYDGGAGFSPSNNYDDNSMPDIVARYNGKAGNLSYSVAGVMREIAYQDTTSGLEDDTYGYGISVSGKWTFGKDDLKFMLSQGNLGRYIALNAFRDGAIEADGEIDLIDQIGGFVAYRHWWSDKWRSTFIYAMTKSDNPDTVSMTTNESVSNASLNLIYSPTKNLSFGGEYILADIERENGDEGEMKRLQFMAKWVF